MAVITIPASDDPHGVVEFLADIVVPYTTDETTPVVITVLRNFGAIGNNKE